MLASHRKPYLFARAWLVVLGLCSALAGQASPVDENLLDDLEQSQGRDQVDVAIEIRERLAQGRPAPALQVRLLQLVGQSENLSKHGLVDMLRYLRPGRELDEAAINAAAAGLASSTRHKWASADQLATLLIDYDKSRPLPAKSMTHLYDAIARAPGMNAANAVQVLQRIPTGDERFERNVAALTVALNYEWDYVREKAAIALAHYGSQGALPAVAINALTRSATADPSVGVRIE